MRVRVSRVVAFVAACTVAPHLCAAQRSAESFASDFFSEYPADATRFTSVPAWVDVARQPDSVLTAELAQALEADYTEGTEVAGEVGGIDFDPFLASQDPCETYRVTRVVPDGDVYLAEVHGDCLSEGPVVIVELVSHGDTFRFANFRYPSVSDDLLSILHAMREARSGKEYQGG